MCVCVRVLRLLQDVGVRVPALGRGNEEARGPAAVADAPRAADAVDIVLDVAGEVIVDDVRDRGDVEPGAANSMLSLAYAAMMAQWGMSWVARVAPPTRGARETQGKAGCPSWPW